MIIVDTALQARQRSGRPVRVGLIGAGFMARGIVNQITNSVPGMEVVAISARQQAPAMEAFRLAGIRDARPVVDAGGVDDVVNGGGHVVVQDPLAVTGATSVDAVVEVTGSIEFAANVVLDAIAHGKHVVLMNAEVDGTIGPILKRYADAAGVIVTACDGDQPGVEMNLFRFVRGIGATPLLCGNIKGLQDPYRNPTTQEGFARRWGQNPTMVTSFADGTKISFEQAIVANGTGMQVARRGMYGYEHRAPIEEVTGRYDVEELRELGGIVDYVVGAEPGPGVYVLATHDDPQQRHYLDLYKLGSGPLYCFYTPYHLCHFEVPTSVARAVLFDDAVLQPIGAPRVEVVTTAKTDLRAGTVLDGVGQYTVYGQCENADTTLEESLLPMGVAEGCVLRRDLPKDAVLTYADVELPPGRLVDRLREEQARVFGDEICRRPSATAAAGTGAIR